MITLSHIAKKAGVSVATASLALRGRGQVADGTAKRIRQIARQLDYRPNPLLASLATRRFRSKGAVEGTPLAILEFSADFGSQHQKTIVQYSKDVAQFARNLGYSPTIYKLANSSPTEPLSRELYHRMAQGIIIIGSMDMDRFGATMDWGHYPVVVCARFAHSLPFHTVRPNIFQAIKLAFDNLLGRGYRRIGFALGHHPIPIEDDESRHGAAIALANRFLPIKDRIPPFEGSYNDPKQFLAWFDRYRPDAVVAFSDGQYWVLKDAGYRIPEDVGLIGLHLAAARNPIKLAGLFQNRNEIARQSVLHLDQLIRNREHGLPKLPLSILVPSHWIEGKTIRPAEPAAHGRS